MTVVFLFLSAPKVWSTGLAPNELVSSMEGVEKERGRIKIDGRLRVPGLEGVFAMGDAAVNPQKPLGPLAQVADQQGKVIGQAVLLLICWRQWTVESVDCFFESDVKVWSCFVVGTSLAALTVVGQQINRFFVGFQIILFYFVHGTAEYQHLYLQWTRSTNAQRFPCRVPHDNDDKKQQQKKYLAKLFSEGKMHDDADMPPFKYRHLGSMAQVGDWKAIADFKGIGGGDGGAEAASGPVLEGLFAFAAWRSAYWTKTVRLVVFCFLCPLSCLFSRDADANAAVACTLRNTCGMRVFHVAVFYRLCVHVSVYRSASMRLTCVLVV